MSLSQPAAQLRWKIALALAVVLAAYAIRLSLYQVLHFPLSAYLAYFPAVILCALALGMWPGLAATIFASLLVVFTAYTPTHVGLLSRGEDIAGLVLSVGTCVAVSVLSEQFRRNQRLLDQLESGEALRSSEERYRIAFQTSLDVMVIARLPDCQSVDVNPRFTEEFGYTRAEALGKTSSELDLWAKDEDHTALVHSFRDGKPYRHVSVEFRKKDGTALWGVASAERLDIHGEPCILVSVRNVTNEKAAQEALKASEARYRTIFESSSDSMSLVRLSDGHLLDVNHRFTQLFGYTCEEALGKTSLELGLWADFAVRNRVLEAFNDVNASYREQQAEFRKRDGSVLWGVITVDRLTANGEDCLLVTIRDITRERQAEDARHAIEARYRAAFETSPDVLVISRLSDGVYMDVNTTFTTITGWKREEVLGLSSKEIDIWVDYANRNAMMEILRKGQDFRNVEIQFRRRDGSIIWGNVFATVIEVDGVPCVLLQMRDLTNEKRAEEEIRNLAFYDQTTGLANRRLLVEQFRKSTALSARTRRKRALLFLDLDNFKTVNDSRGHHTGDLMLREVASRLLSCVSESDTVSRHGGDEFVIILEELHVNSELAATHTMEVADRILTRLNQPYMLNRTENHTSCSIGISLLVDDKTDFTHALQHAEIAMYQAKAAGRNTARFFAPGLQAAVNARATLEDEMRAGIDEKQFVLYYQPQFEDCRLVGVEALLRWQHPRQGLLAPGEFIPLAEETRLIVPLGAWILESACRSVAAWSERYPNTHLTVAVNISALELHRDDFVKSVLDILARTGANPEWLELELTESVLVQDMEVAIAKMNALKAHGIRFALDDFGTGYSSLTYLKRLPLTQLKIDRSFVRDLMTDPSASPIARMIIALSKELGLTVLAEGVEFPEQRRTLEALGCHRHQGYLFAPPLPPDEFEQLLAQHSGSTALQTV
jgi:diguanylate cyclase (GGDEF)-like protein/PAS domain S-box-containing protein